MNIVIIGTGNTATILGKKLRQAGHEILQVFGRDSIAASDLAYALNTESTNYWNVVNRNADIYLLAVSDIAIEEVIRELQLPKKTVVHTAASVPLGILRGVGSSYGVFYPLQSLKKETGHLPEIPLIIDASNEETFSLLEKLADSISANVVRAGDEQRKKIHLAAVFCNNFVNHLYALTEQYCIREKIDFNLLHPLIEETALRIKDLSPSKAQTGPAVRHDDITIERHRELLQEHPQLKEFYDLFTRSISGF